MQNLPCPRLLLLQPETCRASKTFYTQAGAGQKGGVLAPKGACRQVKSVTENEPRVACKFDIEATPDMPKRIRLEGGNGEYKTKGGEREVRREGERERRQCDEGLPKAQPKCCTVFFYRFLPVSLFPLPVAFPLPLPSSPSYPPCNYSPVLQQSNCILASILFSVQKAPEKTHIHCKGRGGRAEQAEHRGRWVGGCINNASNFANCLEMAKCFFSRASESQNATKTLGNAAGSCWINYEKYDAPTEQAERGRGPSALFANVACTLQHATPPVCPCASSRTALWVSNLIVC